MMIDLIKRCQQGDHTAWEVVFRTYWKQAMKLARRLSGSYHAAEDLVQEAFLRLVKSINNYRGDSSFTSWLYQIIRNLYRDKRRKTRAVMLSWESLTEEGKEAALVRDEEPEALLEKKLLWARIKKSLSKLSDKDRRILFLRDFLDYSYQDIATQLQLSVEAVRARLYRTRKLLRNNFATG